MCPEVLFQVLAGLCGCPCVGVPELLCASALPWHSQSVTAVLAHGSMPWLEHPLGMLCKSVWETPVLFHIHAFCSSRVKHNQVAQTLVFSFTELKLAIRLFPVLLPRFLFLAALINFLSVLCTCSSSIAVSQPTIDTWQKSLPWNFPCKSDQTHISSKVDIFFHLLTLSETLVVF